MRDHNVWAWPPVRPPPGAHVINGMFIFSNKVDLTTGQISKRKARFVAIGSQLDRSRYTFDTFAPVSHAVSVRLVMIYALQHRFKLRLIDIVTAFLHADLPKEESVYLRAIPGLEFPPGHAVKLLKALYGLPQAGMLFVGHLSSDLQEFGFMPSAADPCLFVHRDENKEIDAACTAHIDDINGAFCDHVWVELEKFLRQRYKIKVLGETTQLLGIAVDYNIQEGTLALSQTVTIDTLLAKLHYDYITSAPTPALENERLIKASPSPAERLLLLEEWGDNFHSLYRTFVDTLMWIALSTRPDIDFATVSLARFVSDPGVPHFRALKRLLRYLAGTRTYGLLFKRCDTARLVGFADADFAGDLDTRRSTTGTVFILCGAALYWRSRLQKCVTLSTAEAELVALCESGKDTLFMRELLSALDMDLSRQEAITIYEDNSACLVIARNGVRKSRNKHIDTKYFWIHEKVAENIFDIQKIDSKNQLADIFTKALAANAHCYQRGKLGVVDLSNLH